MNVHTQGKYLTLDWDDTTYEECMDRLEKLHLYHSDIKKLVYRQSAGKRGYHVQCWFNCNVSIPLMRFKLQDDPRRLLHDIFNRPDYIHGILWRRKTIEGEVYEAGPWLEYPQQLSIRSLN